MNLRIENQNLKFKISEDELKELLLGHCLNTQVDFLNKVFVIVINPQGLNQGMEAKLICDEGDTYLTLLVSQDKIKELSLMGKSRSGIEIKMGDLSVSLQVDVRKNKRQAFKK